MAKPIDNYVFADVSWLRALDDLERKIYINRQGFKIYINRQGFKIYINKEGFKIYINRQGFS